MMISDKTKLIFDLQDTFSYEEYCSACDKQGFVPDNIGVFLQRAGMVMGAKRRKPENPSEGYAEIISIMNDLHVQTINRNVEVSKTPTRTSACGGCGGGRVR